MAWCRAGNRCLIRRTHFYYIKNFLLIFYTHKDMDYAQIKICHSYGADTGWMR